LVKNFNKFHNVKLTFYSILFRKNSFKIIFLRLCVTGSIERKRIKRIIFILFIPLGLIGLLERKYQYHRIMVKITGIKFNNLIFTLKMNIYT